MVQVLEVMHQDSAYRCPNAINYGYKNRDLIRLQGWHGSCNRQVIPGMTVNPSIPFCNDINNWRSST